MFDLMKKALLRALNEAGVGEYEIYYTCGAETSVGTLNREVNSFASSETGGICLRVLIGGKMGYASTELMTEDEMYELVNRAISNAAAVEKLDTVGIFSGSDEYECSRLPDVHPAGAAELRRAAIKTAERLYAADARVIDGTESQAQSAIYEIRICNSHGLDLVNRCGVNLVLGEAVIESDGEKQADYSYLALDLAREDEIIEKVADEAVRGALNKVGADLVPSGKYNIVLDGKQARSLLSVFSGAFSAKQVLDGMSPLKGKVDTKIASDIITITDDPQREGSTVGTTFDAEGVATHRKSVVDKGVLTTLLHNRETALAFGCDSTANASKAGYSSPIGIRPHSFCIEAGEHTRDELFGIAKEGIFVTEIKGLHAGANSVTGDFSLESEGFMIEDGRLGRAVKSFTVAGNFFELLKKVSDLGNVIERGVQSGLTGFGSPDLLVPDMSVAGI